MNEQELEQFNKAKNKYDFFEQLKYDQNFEVLVDIVKDLIDRLPDLEIEKGDKGDKGDSPTKKELLSMILPLIPDAVPGKPGEKGKDADEIKIIKEVLKNIPKPIKGEDGKTPVKGIDYFDGADGSPDTPEMIVSKLESLEDKEKLKISAIKNLEEELDKLKKQIKLGGQVIYAGGSSGSGGRIVKSYDLSSSLNGSTKTFSIPAFWRVISVHLSSFPNILRETTDYTTDSSLMQITFTSQIDAPSSLSAGQTCIIIFSEA